MYSRACEAASTTVWPYSLALPAMPDAGAVAVPAAAPPPPVVVRPPPVEPVVLPVVPASVAPVPAPPKLGVSLPLLFCDIVFYLLKRIKVRANESARESSLPRKTKTAFPAAGEQTSCRLRPRTSERGKDGAAALPRRASGVRFCCENVRAKCSTRLGTIQPPARARGHPRLTTASKSCK